MPASKKPRKRYKPKPKLANPIAWLMEGFTPVEAQSEYMLNLRLQNANAVDALVRGIATPAHVNVVSAMSNITQALIHLKVGEDFVGLADEGFDAVNTLYNRAVATQRILCRGPEIKAIKDLLELHDAQLRIITVEVMDKAIKLVKAHKIPHLMRYDLVLREATTHQPEKTT